MKHGYRNLAGCTRAYSCPMTRPLTNWHSAHAEQLTRGEHAADRLRNGMGSWFFIGGFVLIMIVWAALNVTAVTWDPYPYILLNLFLSMLAGLQGAILLIAAKRQDAIAAALAEHDYETNLAAKRRSRSLWRSTGCSSTSCGNSVEICPPSRRPERAER